MSPEINPFNAGSIVPHGSPFVPLAAEITQVDFELDVEDLIELSVYSQKRSPTLRRQRLFSAISLAMLTAVALSVFAVGGIRWMETLTSFVACFTLLLFLLPAGSRRANRRLLRKLYTESSNRALLGPRRLGIGPDGLRYSSRLVETAAKWQAVEKIEATPDYGYFYIAAMQAYVVPRRAFGDEAQFAAFLGLARRYRLEAADEPAV